MPRALAADTLSALSTHDDTHANTVFFTRLSNPTGLERVRQSATFSGPAARPSTKECVRNASESRDDDRKLRISIRVGLRVHYSSFQPISFNDSSAYPTAIAIKVPRSL